MKDIKVRFAPSPTGLLHVGNLKIALLNYIFAKKVGAKFVLRIDDTDSERSTKESEEQILKDLAWIGIKYDEFFRQSERVSKYHNAFEKLREQGRVYPCFETKEELALKRKTQTMNGVPPVYDRAALQLTDIQRKKLEESGVKPYWRFKLNETNTVEWKDLVHGEIHIPLNTISDPVIVKPDGNFIYTFASVVDDADIGITHIIRGDDHITNTAAQIDIFEAICGKKPEFAHIPLMSSIDGQEVSKRTGSPLSVVNMRNDGILPEAVVDVLVNLGTSENIDYHDTMESLIKKFSFEKMSLASPKFNIEDIRVVNRKILAEKTFEEVKNKVLSAFGEMMNDNHVSLEKLWDLVKGNINKVSDVVFWYDVLCGTKNEKKEENEEKIDKKFLQQMLESIPISSTSDDLLNFDAWIAKLKEISGKKGRELFHPIRTVLTGLENGPELRKIVSFLGRTAVLKKINSCIENSTERSE